MSPLPASVSALAAHQASARFALRAQAVLIVVLLASLGGSLADGRYWRTVARDKEVLILPVPSYQTARRNRVADQVVKGFAVFVVKNLLNTRRATVEDDYAALRPFLERRFADTLERSVRTLGLTDPTTDWSEWFAPAYGEVVVRELPHDDGEPLRWEVTVPGTLRQDVDGLVLTEARQVVVVRLTMNAPLALVNPTALVLTDLWRLTGDEHERLEAARLRMLRQRRQP